MPSDPLAFVTSRDIKNSLTSVSVHRMSLGHSPTREGSRRSMTSRAGYDLLKHVEKKLFSMFVMSVESKKTAHTSSPESSIRNQL